MSSWLPYSINTPLVYESGDWDGMRSSKLLITCTNGEVYIAYYYSGILDGIRFGEWYSVETGQEVLAAVALFREIPDLNE